MRDPRFVFVYALPQEVGDTLIKTQTITNKIQKFERKRICACWWVALFISASLCVRVSVSAYVDTCVREHISVWSNSPRYIGVYMRGCICRECIGVYLYE